MQSEEQEREEIESFRCDACDMDFNSSEELDDHNVEQHGAQRSSPESIESETDEGEVLVPRIQK